MDDDSSATPFAKRNRHAGGTASLARQATEVALAFPAMQRIGALSSRCEVTAHATGKLDELADVLGLPAWALTAGGVGWHVRRCCWTFPMFDEPDPVAGIRTRYPNGRKAAVLGSRNGLFGLDVLAPDADLVLVVEGASDTIAGLALGLAVAGKPSATAGDDLLVRHLRSRRVAVLADADDAGRAGAHKTADWLAAVCPDVRVIEPPGGIKDLRQWFNSGGTRADVLAAVEQAEPVGIEVEA